MSGLPAANPATSATSRPIADARPERLVAGVAICCIALLVAWLSWRWYQQGIPGTPQVPLDWGQSSIRAYAPPDVAVSTTVEYRDEWGTDKPSGPRVSGSLAHIELEAESTRTQPYLVILELAYGAHLSKPDVSGSFGKAPIEIATTYQGPDPVVGSWPVYAPVQLFVAKVEPMQGRRLFAGVSGRVSQPIAVSSNARTAIYTPAVESPGKCVPLGSAATVINLDSWITRIVPDCHASADKTETETISLSDMARNKRLDYADPAASEPGRLRWTQTGSLRVDASYVDLDDEADGQRLLFLSGVGVGLASAGLPIGLQIVAEERRRARRRTGT